MGSSSKPKVKIVDTRTAEQKTISKYLESIIPGRMAQGLTPPTGEENDLSLMGESWTKGVVRPMKEAC